MSHPRKTWKRPLPKASACFLLDRLLQYADFVSVGTNDLAQLTFAWEREEIVDPLLLPEVNGLMVRLIGEAAERTTAAGKHLTVCGEMAADSAVLPALIDHRRQVAIGEHTGASTRL